MLFFVECLVGVTCLPMTNASNIVTGFLLGKRPLILRTNIFLFEFSPANFPVVDISSFSAAIYRNDQNCYYDVAVKQTAVCGQRNETVCDTHNREHSSLCQLLQHGASLGHRGHCKVSYQAIKISHPPKNRSTISTQIPQ